LRTHKFKERRESLKKILGREADGLEGFHGTHPDAVIPICQDGFDKSRRSGQVYGAGEYFAKNPTVSFGYCKGGEFMLVCRLTLGEESTTQANKDGDHIWVPETGYYVIKEPEQVLPQYIIKFSNGSSFNYCGYGGRVTSSHLESILAQRVWSTKVEEEKRPVPRQRDCMMSRATATVLWIGFLHGHISDETLEQDVRNFLTRHARDYMDGVTIQIVKGHFKKAHAILQTPMPRELVHKLNRLEFVEDGKRRTVCVEDAHGSPGQKCPKFIAGYCRGQNLRFTHPCWCDHPARPTEKARYELTPIALDSAKGVELHDKFMGSAPFHNGRPRVIGIKAIHNQVLSRCHEDYQEYLATKHMEEPQCKSCTTAPTITSSTFSTSMDCSHLQISKLQSDVQNLEGKDYAPHYATTIAIIALRSMSGASVTCMVWESTWPTWHRSRIGMCHSPRLERQGVKLTAWSFVAYWASPFRLRAIFGNHTLCTTL
jgi:hypothetical protein